MDRPKYTPGLAARVLRQIEEHPETWDQGNFPCVAGPTCAAGWAIRLCGLPVTCNEFRFADLVMHAGVNWMDLRGPSNIFSARRDPRPRLRQLAARDEYMRTRSGGMGRWFCSALEGVDRG